MGTRSRIGIENEDGTITSIYCHWDGYVFNNGAMLYHYYDNVDKINQLMELGDLSSLGPEIGEKHDWNSDNKEWCLSYGRDRGERNTEARISTGYNDFLRIQEEYNYVFKPKENVWYVRKQQYNDYIPVVTLLAKGEDD